MMNKVGIQDVAWVLFLGVIAGLLAYGVWAIYDEYRLLAQALFGGMVAWGFLWVVLFASGREQKLLFKQVVGVITGVSLLVVLLRAMMLYVNQSFVVLGAWFYESYLKFYYLGSLIIWLVLVACAILCWLKHKQDQCVEVGEVFAQVFRLVVLRVVIFGFFVVMMLLLCLLGSSLIDAVGIPLRRLFEHPIWFFVGGSVLASLCVLPLLTFSLDGKKWWFLNWVICMVLFFVGVHLLALPFAQRAVVILESSSLVHLLMAGILWVCWLFCSDTEYGRWYPVYWVANVVGFLLVLLSCRGMWLRIEQYGLTPERVLMVWVIAIALIGYVAMLARLLALGRQVWIKLIWGSVLGIGVVMYLPWLDAVRLSFHSQLRRVLTSHELTAADELYFQRYFGEKGKEALLMLQQKVGVGSVELVEQAVVVNDVGDDEISWEDFWQRRVIFCVQDKDLLERFRKARQKVVTKVKELEERYKKYKYVVYAFDVDNDLQLEIMEFRYSLEIGEEARGMDVEIDIFQLWQDELTRYPAYSHGGYVDYQDIVQCNAKLVPAVYPDVMVGKRKIAIRDKR